MGSPLDPEPPDWCRHSRTRLSIAGHENESVQVKVKRIVADVAASDPGAASRFYRDILGLDILMDMGWIATYGSHQTMAVQVSFVTKGGRSAPVPDLSIEVDDLDTALARIRHAKIPIEYGPTREPWAVAPLLRPRSVRHAREHPDPRPVERRVMRGSAADVHSRHRAHAQAPDSC